MSDPTQPGAAQVTEAAASAAQAGSSDAAATVAPSTPDGADEYREFAEALRANGRTPQEAGSAFALYDRFVGAPDQLEAFVKNIPREHHARAAIESAVRPAIIAEMFSNSRSVRELKRMLAAREGALAEERGDSGYTAPAYDSSFEPASGGDETPTWFRQFATGLDERFKAIEGKADGAVGVAAQTRHELVQAADLTRVARQNPIAAANFDEWSRDVQIELRTGAFQGPGGLERASKKVLGDWIRKGSAAGLRQAPAAPALNGFGGGNGKEPTQAESDAYYAEEWKRARRSGNFTEVASKYLNRRNGG